MKKILLAMSLLVGGVAFAQQDLQEQINQLLKANGISL